MSRSGGLLVIGLWALSAAANSGFGAEGDPGHPLSEPTFRHPFTKSVRHVWSLS